MYRLQIDPAVTTKFPGYSALIIYAEGLENGPSDPASLEILRQAEAAQRSAFGEEKASSHLHIAAWRTAYQQMGVKPSKYPCSVEALLSRVLKGSDLPAINRLVDLYNAVSLRYVLPVGGEDWTKLTSDLVLRPAQGDEPFATIQEGAEAVSYPEPGEIIWADSAGVTCRLWNWRQCYRTRLTETSPAAYFVLDRLAPYPLATLQEAGQELMGLIRQSSPGCHLEYKLLGSQV